MFKYCLAEEDQIPRRAFQRSLAGCYPIASSAAVDSLSGEDGDEVLEFLIDIIAGRDGP
jgi:hypothetical protein